MQPSSMIAPNSCESDSLIPTPTEISNTPNLKGRTLKILKSSVFKKEVKQCFSKTAAIIASLVGGLIIILAAVTPPMVFLNGYELFSKSDYEKDEAKKEWGRRMMIGGGSFLALEVVIIAGILITTGTYACILKCKRQFNEWERLAENNT